MKLTGAFRQNLWAIYDLLNSHFYSNIQNLISSSTLEWDCESKLYSLGVWQMYTQLLLTNTVIFHNLDQILWLFCNKKAGSSNCLLHISLLHRWQVKICLSELIFYCPFICNTPCVLESVFHLYLTVMCLNAGGKLV